MEATIRELEALKIPAWRTWGTSAVVTEAMGESEGYHLMKNYDDLINLGIKCWLVPLRVPEPGLRGLRVLPGLCRRSCSRTSWRSATQMISGIDVIAYEAGRRAEGLPEKAILLGVEAVTSAPGWPVVEAALKKTAQGVEWLAR